MTKKIKIQADNFYGFVIDLSFLDCVFQPPYHEETIDIDYEDITHQKKLSARKLGKNSAYKKNKVKSFIARCLAMI